MVVLVHDNAKVPSIDLTSIFLSTGRHHKLGYSKKETTYLPSPYSSCTDTIPLRLQIMYEQYNGTDYGYSQYECFQACIQAYT